MDLEWDPAKARLNQRKHGVAFADVVPVLEDPNALTIGEDTEDGEQRQVTIGVDGFGRVLVVVYTWRPGAVRIISARKATPVERKKYVEGL